MNVTSAVPPIVAYRPVTNGIGHGFHPMVGVKVLQINEPPDVFSVNLIVGDDPEFTKIPANHPWLALICALALKLTYLSPTTTG